MIKMFNVEREKRLERNVLLLTGVFLSAVGYQVVAILFFSVFSVFKIKKGIYIIFIIIYYFHNHMHI